MLVIEGGGERRGRSSRRRYGGRGRREPRVLGGVLTDGTRLMRLRLGSMVNAEGVQYAWGHLNGGIFF